jgi:hypothetical protein
MSADNGLILWHDGDEYVVSEYSGSREYDSNADMPRRGASPTLAGAVRCAGVALVGVEYGLSVELADSLLAAEERQALAALPQALPDTPAPAGPRSRMSPLAETEA